MGILTKDSSKKNHNVMVRLPYVHASFIDGLVGDDYSSRPDFVLDSIRKFMHFVLDQEIEIINYLQKKEDAPYEVKSKFYYESIKFKTETYRAALVRIQESGDKRVVDVLLSIPLGLLSEIGRLVERTKCFRNHQELIKCAVVFNLVQIGTDSANILFVDNFLASSMTSKELESLMAHMREEMTKMTGPTFDLKGVDNISDNRFFENDD